MSEILTDGELDQLASQYHLQLSAGFEKKLAREGKDITAARRATAHLLQGQADSMMQREHRFETPGHINLLRKLWAEGLIDINATYQYFPQTTSGWGYVYHTLFVHENYDPLVKLVLPQVSDAIVRAPIPLPTGIPADPLILPTEQIRRNPLLQAFLEDGRIDPWTQKNSQGADFFQAIQADCDCMWQAWQKHAALFENGFKELDDRVKILIEAGVPLKVSPTPGLNEVLSKHTFTWMAVRDGYYPMDTMDVQTARHLGSRYGYAALFDPAIWQGHEAHALQLIAQLPQWTHPFMTREMAALQSTAQPGWVARTSLAPKATERGAA